MFMWNDGIGFFSTMADHKLPRILGAKAGWCDKFMNTRNVVMFLISFTVAVYVCATELFKYKTEKAREVMLIPNHEFQFNASEQMPLIGVFYLDVNQLFDKMQELEANIQNKN
jgi:hypothetical protein